MYIMAGLVPAMTILLTPIARWKNVTAVRSRDGATSR
jgi:hypothetical protein